MDTDELECQIRTVLAPVLGEDLKVDRLERLPGGASRETWMFEASGSSLGTQRLILRRDPPGAVASGLRLEAGLLEAARLAGVPVPRVVTSGEAFGENPVEDRRDRPTETPNDGLVEMIGEKTAKLQGAIPDRARTSSQARASPGSYLVVEFVDGETIPRRILRDEKLAAARAILAERCGEALAAIHRIPTSSVRGLAGGDPFQQLRELMDRLGEPHPAFELAFRWLAAHRPALSGESVVHGDFRNGNLIVGPDGLRAVLDWELAHVGDPIEDLGWLCVKAWRFGSPLPVGGFGTVEQLVSSYVRAGGVEVDMDALRWWEVFGTLRWGVICIVQTLTHTSGALRSVELAAIGRRVCEVEWDLLELLP